MVKKLLVLGIILLFVQQLFAQKDEIERLRRLTSIVSYDSFYVKNAITLGSYYQDSKVDSTFFLAESALFVSRKINYLKGQILGLNQLGVGFIRFGNYTSALEVLLEGLKISEKIEISKPSTMLLTNLGDLYFKQGEIQKALEYSLKAKNIAEALNDTLNICANYINLGNSYETLNILDSAFFNTQMGNNVALKIHHPDDILIAQNYIGISLNNLGNIRSKTKDFGLAKEFYRSSFPYFIKTEDYDGLCESYLGIAKVFQTMGEKDSALHYARNCFTIATNNKFYKFIYDASSFISHYYEGDKVMDSAFKFQEIMIAAKDTLFSQEKVKQLQIMTIGESLRQQQIAEEKLKAEEERKNNLQYMAIAAFIFMFSLFIILISRRSVRLTTINFMVTVALLLVFEYISLFIHPYISIWTHHEPIYMLLILVAIAAILVPMHHRLEFWIKENLSHKIIHPKTKKMKIKTGGEEHHEK